jgi:capsular exopolysaccharide synthesis family protein
MTYTQAVWLIVLASAILLVQILILARRKSAVVPIQNEAFDLPDRPRRFRTAFRIILMVGGLGTLIGTASYFVSLEYNLRYTATAGIEVIPQSDDPLEATTPSVNSDIQYHLRNTKASLLRPETVCDELLRSDRIRKTQWFRQFTKRGFDSMENSGGDIITLVSRYLQRHLLVTVEKDSPWIWVAFSCYGPSGKEESAFILNEIVNIFISKQRSITERKFIEQKMVFDRQRADIQRALDTAQGAIKGFLDGSTFPDLLTDTKDSYLSSLLVQLELRRIDLDSQITSIDRKIQLLERPVSKADDDSPVHGTSMQLSIRETQTSQVTAPTDNEKTPVSPDKTPSATPDSATIGDLRQERAMSVSQLETLQLKIQETKKTLGERTRAREQIDPIRARRDAAQRSLDYINKELEKLDARVASPSFVGLYPGLAIVPEEPSSPLWYVHVPIGFMCGLLMGLQISFFIEIRNRGLRSCINDIRRLGVPQLGEIGHEDNEDDIDGVDLSQVVRQAPFSMMSEDYRKLRITLRQQESAADKKILLVTSPTGEDGKTTVASNLALILINEGRKVLFIDANFRKPASLRIFPLAAGGDSKGHADFGLSNYLLGQCTDPHDFLRRTGIEGLDVIDSGPVPPNPIAASAMRKLLDTVRDAYDFILIDGPAMLVSDALELAALAEGTIVVFNGSHIKKGQAQQVLDELKQVQAVVLGTVLVGVKMVKGSDLEERYLAYQQYLKIETPSVRRVE